MAKSVYHSYCHLSSSSFYLQCQHHCIPLSSPLSGCTKWRWQARPQGRMWSSKSGETSPPLLTTRSSNNNNHQNSHQTRHQNCRHHCQHQQKIFECHHSSLCEALRWVRGWPWRTWGLGTVRPWSLGSLTRSSRTWQRWQNINNQHFVL